LLDDDGASALPAYVLAGPFAFFTGFGLSPGLRTGSAAAQALRPGELYRLGAAMEHPFQRHCDGQLEVGASARPGAAAEGPVEEAAAEPDTTVAEQIGAENVLQVNMAKQILCRIAGDAGMAAGVVIRPSLRIGGNRIGLGDFLEPFLGARLLIAVGVVFEGQLAEGVLYRLLIRLMRDAQTS
jgi:hypothetical protein